MLSIAVPLKSRSRRLGNHPLNCKTTHTQWQKTRKRQTIPYRFGYTFWRLRLFVLKRALFFCLLSFHFRVVMCCCCQCSEKIYVHKSSLRAHPKHRNTKPKKPIPNPHSTSNGFFALVFGVCVDETVGRNGATAISTWLFIWHLSPEIAHSNVVNSKIFANFPTQSSSVRCTWGYGDDWGTHKNKNTQPTQKHGHIALRMQCDACKNDIDSCECAILPVVLPLHVGKTKEAKNRWYTISHIGAKCVKCVIFMYNITLSESDVVLSVALSVFGRGVNWHRARTKYYVYSIYYCASA